MKRTFTILTAALLLLTLIHLPGKAVGQTKAEGDELAICQGTGSGYGERRTLTDSHSVGWVLATGQSGFLGTNSAPNHSKVKPTADDIPVVKAVNSYAVANTTTGYYFYYTTTAVSNVGSLVFSYTANQNNTTATGYVVVGDAVSAEGGENYTKIELASDSPSAQGVSLGSNGTFTFKFAETQTSARYYGFIIQTNSYKRMTGGTIKLLEGSTGPTKLSTPTNFTATAGNGEATFTWDEVANASSYTISYTPAGGDEATVTGITGISRTITGLTNGTEYTCKIKAVGNGTTYEDSDYSSTITVTPAYVITITSPITGGSVTASAATATTGTTITLTATPSEGYYFNNIAANWSVTPTVTVTLGANNTATFAMPASNVTVGATFTALPVYNVICTTPTNGTLSVSPTSGYNGVEVTITATPNSGYKLATLTATDNDGEITITNNKFNIRNSNVTVSATFGEADVYEKYTGAIVDGDYVIGYISSGNGDTKKTIGTYRQDNKFNPTDMSPENDQLIDPTQVWRIESSGDYWTIYNVADEKYLTGTGSASQVGYEASPTPESKKLWTITVSDGLYTIKNKYNNDQNITNNFFRYGGTYWACYSSGRGSFLYKKVVNSTLTVASPSNGTITATPAGGSAIAEGESLSVRNGTTISLNATGDSGYVLDAWDVYKTDDASTKVTVTNNQFTMPDYGVTVSASFRQPTTFTMQYSVNGAIVSDLTQSGIAENTPVTLPTTGFTVPTGFDYAGWTENEVSAEMISTATYTPTANTTLYLVFVKSGQTPGYNKVTSLDNITPGTYIIVNDNYCLPSVTTTSSPVKSDNYKVTNASTTNNYTSVPANTEWLFTGTKTEMTIKNSDGSYLYSTSSNSGIRVSTTNDTWAFETNGSGFAMKEATNSKYCATYASGSDWRGYGEAGHTNYGDGGILYLFKKTPVYTRIYTQTISGYGNDNNAKTGWHLIASPVAISPEDVTNMTTDTYDLYKFNEENNMWYNYKENTDPTAPNADPNFDLVPGEGYLYAHNGDGVTLTFSGVPYSGNGQVTLRKQGSGNLAGWNLVGNPFGNSNAIIAVGQGDPAREFYRMNAAGSEVALASGPIAAMEGVFVVAESDGEVITLTETTAAVESPSNGASVVMNLVKNRGGVIDRAIVHFDESKAMPKFQLFENSTKLYIAQNGEDYASVRAQAQGEMPVSFHANENGQYTLTVNAEGVEMNYLHLIDNMTGADIDLLQTPSYTFNATTSDYTSRFKLVFAANEEDGPSTSSGTFAFYNGSEWVISNMGEATLQVVDVMGRVVSTETVSGNATMNTNSLSAGIYMMRLINGNDVKVQKIVVR